MRCIITRHRHNHHHHHRRRTVITGSLGVFRVFFLLFFLLLALLLLLTRRSLLLRRRFLFVFFTDRKLAAADPAFPHRTRRRVPLAGGEQRSVKVARTQLASKTTNSSTESLPRWRHQSWPSCVRTARHQIGLMMRTATIQLKLGHD